MVIQRYRESIDNFFELYLFNIYLVIRIAELSKTEAKKRGAKHISDDYDKAFIDKLWTNKLISYLVHNESLNLKFRKLHFDSKIEEDFVKKLYKSFSELPEYKKYIKSDNDDNSAHLEILLSLYRFIRKNEFFEEQVEGHYSAWNDDSSLIIGAVKRSLKSIPLPIDDFYSEFIPDDETVDEFGAVLLKSVLNNNEDLETIILPTLKNWDKDRVANLDMIMIKMAVSEFIYFDSIPTKVTLNEYVEMSKLYSTEKSKDFVNGIMDRIMRDLTESGRINKIK
ncbi:UNVERIFIED_CONTAM: hypothetical protein GTU68_032512 [Idotea baltica]|nr:hypothetical protein [Idotea baltica]